MSNLEISIDKSHNNTLVSAKNIKFNFNTTEETTKNDENYLTFPINKLQMENKNSRPKLGFISRVF